MQFSDVSTKTGLIQDCEFLCSLGDGGISGNSVLLAQFTRNINEAMNTAVSIILNSQDDWDFDDLNNSTDFPVATTPLIAGQRQYVLPASLNVLKVKRVDISYDGGTTYYRATPFDSGSTGIAMGNDTNTDQFFSNTEPRYDLLGNSIWVYPLGAGIIRMEFQRNAYLFVTSDTTKAPGLDLPFHRFLSVSAAVDYAVIKNLPQAPNLASKMAELATRMQVYYGKKDNDTIYALQSNLPDYS